MDSIIEYLKNGSLPEGPNKNWKVRRNAARFWLSPEGKLYRRSYSGPYLQCFNQDNIESLLWEIQEGCWGAHQRAQLSPSSYVTRLLVAVHAKGCLAVCSEVWKMSTIRQRHPSARQTIKLNSESLAVWQMGDWHSWTYTKTSRKSQIPYSCYWLLYK